MTQISHMSFGCLCVLICRGLFYFRCLWVLICRGLFCFGYLVGLDLQFCFVLICFGCLWVLICRGLFCFGCLVGFDLQFCFVLICFGCLWVLNCRVCFGCLLLFVCCVVCFSLWLALDNKQSSNLYKNVQSTSAWIYSIISQCIKVKRKKGRKEGRNNNVNIVKGFSFGDKSGDDGCHLKSKGINISRPSWWNVDSLDWLIDWLFVSLIDWLIHGCMTIL